MEHPPVFFMNIGWMTAYQGLVGDKILGGGEFVKKREFGYEMFNFKPFRGRNYSVQRTIPLP